MDRSNKMLHRLSVRAGTKTSKTDCCNQLSVWSLEAFQDYVRCQISNPFGESRSEVEAPQPGIQAQRPRTRTARTTRQINGAILVGG